MEEAIKTIHKLSACIHEEGHHSEADDDEFEEVQTEE